MGEITFAAAASHAPGLIGLFDSAPEESRKVVSEAYGTMARDLHAAELDLLIVLANDHLANSRVRTYPDFLLGMAEEHRGPFEWFKPWIGCRDYVVPGARDHAEALFTGVNARGIRMFATHDNLKFDDNISVPTLLCDLDVSPAPPMVPILQNCTVPPLPDTQRSLEFGRALADSIREDLPEGTRVGLFGSGGLSHEPGGARYFYIDEEFDHWFLECLAQRDYERLFTECTVDRMDSAGAGGTAELLAWFDVMGAIGDRPCEVLGYTAYEDWKCGVGAVRWDMSQGGETVNGTRTDDGARTKGGKAFSFDLALVSHDLIQDLKWDVELRARFERDESSVLDMYPLRPAEREAIEKRDFRALYDLGIHPYLGGQLARLIYGNEAGKGASVAVRKLVESLQDAAS